MAAYFAVINAASIVGVVKGTFGRVSGVWSTPRAAGRAAGAGRWCRWARSSSSAGRCWPRRWCSPGTHSAFVPHASRSGVRSPRSSTSTRSIRLLLSLLRLTSRRPIRIADCEPSVCLFIAANDEAAVIAAKLDNALALDYPADKLQIVVASDGSVDGTDDIVRRYSPRVQLIARSPRQGKIAAINHGLANSIVRHRRLLGRQHVPRSRCRARPRPQLCVRGGRLRVSGDVTPGRRPGAARQVRGSLLSLRALDPARRVRHRLDDRRRRRPVRDPAEALRASRRGHDPRRHGHSDGDCPGRRAGRVRASRARAGARRRSRRWRSSPARRAWSPAPCSSWPDATARCRSRRRK